MATPAPRISVVLPAGGSGLRTGTPTPKQVILHFLVINTDLFNNCDGTSRSIFRQRNQHTPQYWKILDRPLLYYTLEVFDSIDWIDRVVVAVSQDNLEPMQQQVRKQFRKFKIIHCEIK